MDPSELIDRLRQSVDDHDLDAVVACFTNDYRNETPAHPGRGFEGSEQVRINWQRIFAGVPNISARVLRTSVTANTVWSEWEMDGTRLDGVPQLLRGVIIFGVAGDLLEWARFYLEPVDTDEGGVDAAVAEIVEVEQ